MEIDQLQSADLLLFSYIPGDFSSELIHLLTGSPVSHAAMVWQDPSQLIEQSPPSVQLNPIAKRVLGRTVTVMRFAGTADLDKVLSAANHYLQAKVPYSRELEKALALLFAVQYSKPGPIEQTVLAEILLLATHQLTTPADQPLMVCSTFVVQSYIDAGVDLQLNPSVLPLSFIDRMIAILSATETGSSGKTSAAEHPQLTAQLTDLQSLTSQLAQRLSQRSEHELALAAGKLAQQICTQMHWTTDGSLLQALETLKAHRAVFVSPYDLLCHAAALQQVGVIDGNT